MSDMRISSMLYSLDSGKEIVCCKGFKVNMSLPSGIGFSSARGVSSTNAKISLAAVFLDKLFVESKIFAYQSNIEHGVYCEISGNPIYIRDEMIITESTIDPKKYVFADILYQLTFGTNEEMKDIFAEAVLQYNAEKTITPEIVARFCDSYYYGCIKPNPIRNQESILVKEEYEAAMRSSQLEPIPIFKDVHGMAPCSFGTPTATKKKKKIKKDDGTENIISKCQDGEYKVPFEWSSEQEEYIQDVSSLSDFIPSETFVDLLNKIKFRTNRVIERMDMMGDEIDRVKAIGKDYINCTLVGKPGTGKTRLAYALSAATGMPVYTSGASHNTDEDEFEGKTKLVEGKPTAVPTDALKAFENGGIFLLEEVNLAQAAVIMGALGQAVEFPFILKKDGYETIRRHPLCIFITTMNIGTAGSKMVSQPFSNRFKQTFVLNDPDRDEFIRILETTGESKALCSWVYDRYSDIVDYVETQNAMADTESIKMLLSMRSCIGAIENIQEGMNPKKAMKNSIIGKIAEIDLEVAEDCNKNCLEMAPDFS